MRTGRRLQSPIAKRRIKMNILLTTFSTIIVTLSAINLISGLEEKNKEQVKSSLIGCIAGSVLAIANAVINVLF